MKKLLLLALTAIMMVGCDDRTTAEIEEEKRLNLRTGDTIHVESYKYIVNSNKIYRFIRRNYSVVADINDPVYVKRLK